MILNIPQTGDYRIKSKFAFLPIKLNERQEAWLQNVYKVQIYTTAKEWSNVAILPNRNEAEKFLKSHKEKEHFERNKYNFKSNKY